MRSSIGWKHGNARFQIVAAESCIESAVEFVVRFRVDDKVAVDPAVASVRIGILQGVILVAGRARLSTDRKFRSRSPGETDASLPVRNARHLFAFGGVELNHGQNGSVFPDFCIGITDGDADAETLDEEFFAFERELGATGSNATYILRAAKETPSGAASIG